jgi:uncharacterized protein (DUF983 family)
MTSKNQSILTYFALVLPMVLLMSFGPKRKLKGIWIRLIFINLYKMSIGLSIGQQN